MRVKVFKRFGLWHYRCPCCPDAQPMPHRSYRVMLVAAHAHINSYHWRAPRLHLSEMHRSYNESRLF